MAMKQRLSVLVVDQDEATTIDLKEYLAKEGYRVQLLSDPSVAAEEIRQNRYQLVFVDVSPGNQAGLEALGAMRSIDSDLCVIAMTGLPSVEMAVATMKHQAFHYLQKPLDEDELKAVIDAAIQETGLLIDLETRLNSEVGGRIRERIAHTARQEVPVGQPPPADATGRIFRQESLRLERKRSDNKPHITEQQRSQCQN